MSVVDFHSPEPNYQYTDPQLLGGMLVVWTFASFSKGPRRAIYQCNGHSFRFIAGGSPFEVEVFEMKSDGDVRLFNVLNTGDGLTFDFSGAKAASGVAMAVIAGAKDRAAARHV